MESYTCRDLIVSAVSGLRFSYFVLTFQGCAVELTITSLDLARLSQRVVGK